jgi:hypothetical protein
VASRVASAASVVDEARFQQLYVEHADAVFTFVSRRLPSGDAEGLVDPASLGVSGGVNRVVVTKIGWLRRAALSRRLV